MARDIKKKRAVWLKSALNSKKHAQLGMNAGTAAHRLRRDVLFKLIDEAGHLCFRCGEAMQRDNFSIEHIVPWLDSPNPVLLFFDLNNISFSHKHCNSDARRKPQKRYTKEEQKMRNNAAARLKWANMSKEDKQARRKRRYKRDGR
jgi:hypothetical protein